MHGISDSKTDGRGGVTRKEKFLTFNLAGEQYGLEILMVREIIGLMDITTVPQTPVFVRGVINLRGKVIPIIDLRKKFGMQSIEDTEQTCIIVVDFMESQVMKVKGKLWKDYTENYSRDLQAKDKMAEIAKTFAMNASGAGSGGGGVMSNSDLADLLVAKRANPNLL